MLSIETILSRTTGRRLSSNQKKRLKVTDLPALGLSEDDALAIQAHVAVIEVMQQQIAKVEKRLQQSVAPEDDFKRLMTVPGIGTVLATMIYLGHFESCARPRGPGVLERCLRDYH